jgi:hypothetical protein
VWRIRQETYVIVLEIHNPTIIIIGIVKVQTMAISEISDCGSNSDPFLRYPRKILISSDILIFHVEENTIL